MTQIEREEIERELVQKPVTGIQKSIEKYSELFNDLKESTLTNHVKGTELKYKETGLPMLRVLIQTCIDHLAIFKNKALSNKIRSKAYCNLTRCHRDLVRFGDNLVQ